MNKHFVGYGPQERDFNQEELPRVRRELVFRHFGSDAGHPLLRTEWKDGIDLEVPTYALQCFAEAYAREVLASLATPAAPTAEPAEPVLWQFRWLNPANNSNAEGSMQWEPVVVWMHHQTIEQRIQELRDFRYQGKPIYEVRALYATPPAAGLVAEPPEQPNQDSVHQVGAPVGLSDAANPASPWIAVSERLPAVDSGQVFVWVAHPTFAKEPFVIVDEWITYHEDPLGMGGPTIATGCGWAENDYDDITHWMPLPEAPKDQQ